MRELALVHDSGKPVAANFCLIEYDAEGFNKNIALLEQPFEEYVRRAIKQHLISIN